MINQQQSISPIIWKLSRLLLFVLLFARQDGWSNNLQINNILLMGQNTVQHFSLIKFDIGWENSWRSSVGPANWDATWVFIKYRVKTETDWKHATLNWVDGSGTGDGHVVPANATVASSDDNGSGGSRGVFIYHNTDMLQGAVNYADVELRWNYGIDGVLDADSVELCVMGIEMVRVPGGQFVVGDGTTSNIAGQFHDASDVTLPFPISSENAITLGGNAPGSLGDNNGANMQLVQDDFNNVTTQTLPASFPKGYQAFYCMKYEITQQEFVTFLNKLTYQQQKSRTQGVTPPNSAIGTHVLTFFGTPFRNSAVIMNPGVDPGTPAVYACDLNDNGIYDEANDGQNIACNNLSWADLAAYLDWTALRPMTELEFEKACRGTQPAVAEEYAWGNTNMNLVTGVLNDGMAIETASDPNANCNNTDWTSMGGPVRVGSLGQGINTREGTGATYYGIMEMSGNVWERTVTVGNPAGRVFTGRHGDGALAPIFVLGLYQAGDANESGWPDNTADGSGFRGGAWYFFDPQAACVSNRIYAASNQPLAVYDFGGRGVRTAPY